MFAKLKKKIQEEAQNVVSSAEGDRRPTAKATSPAPGLASPVSKDYPGGPIFSHSRKDSSDMSSKMGSRTSSVDDIARESSSKEEVLAMLMKRTEQVKKLESRISELAAMMKEKNRKMEKLEITLEKQQESAAQDLSEMTEKYQAERAKVSEGFTEAVNQKEGKNSRLEAKLHKAEEYREKYFKTEEESDELQGLSAQELAKIKHMLLNTQADLKQKTQDFESSNRKVHDLENEIKSLLQQVTVITSKCEETEETNKSLTHGLEDAQNMAQKTKLKLESMNTEIQVSQQLHSELQVANQAMQNNASLQQKQFDREKEAHLEQISHLEERIRTLEQRLQEGNLTVDERVKSLETERDALEGKLTSSREQLSESKSASSQKLVLLEQEILKLRQQAKDSTDSTEKYQKDHQEIQNTLQKEIDSWKSRLQMALVEVKEKDRLLETAKEHQEAELMRYQKKSSALEEGLRDQLRQLKQQLDSSERVREREWSTAQEKITKLENGQEDWLEREIDAERQITKLEEDLQKAKVEVSEKDKDILNMKKQLIVKRKELEESEAKKQALEQTVQSHQQETQSYESSFSAIQQELHGCNLERDDLLLRNAQLSQEFESHKRKAAQDLTDAHQEVHQRQAAVAGLEQSLIDLQCEGQQQGEKLKTLESQREAALDHMESDEITRLKKELSTYEAQLLDKTKTIKMLQQRLTDLKKTLQRELKVQALPNDEPSDRLAASPSSKDVREVLPQETANGLHSSASMPDIKPDTSHPVIPVLQSSHQHFPSRKAHGPHRGANSAYMRPYPPDVYRDGLAMGKDMSVTGYGSFHGHSSRDDKRKEHSGDQMNFEYLKHVVLKFMLSHEHEAVHLIKAIAVLLHFSPDEQRLLKETLEWKMSWFGTKPQLGRGQQAKVVPSPYH